MADDAKPPPAYIYRLELYFWEHVFFSSREISEFFQTEPVVGNYALAYALGLANSTYHAEQNNKQQAIYYKRDLTPLNNQGIYVTPATILGEPLFSLTQFNAQTDTYWFAFTNNAIAVKYDDRKTFEHQKKWHITDPLTGKSSMVRATNFPQHGRIKLLARGNKAATYIISREEIDHLIPPYIRLGKFMSKCEVQFSRCLSNAEVLHNMVVPIFLNAVDLVHPQTLTVYDLLSIHPAPLIKNANVTGWFYRAPDNMYLPSEMRFGVNKLL